MHRLPQRRPVIAGFGIRFNQCSTLNLDLRLLSADFAGDRRLSPSAITEFSGVPASSRARTRQAYEGDIEASFKMRSVRMLFCWLVATQRCSALKRNRNGGVQKHAHLVEQFSEPEWLCQGFETVQVFGALANQRQRPRNHQHWDLRVYRAESAAEF